MANLVPLGSDLMAREGERMTFTKELLKEATSHGTYVTIHQIADAWLARKGRSEIDYKERAKLHNSFRERTRKLASRGLALCKPAFAMHRGQAAVGWRWDESKVDPDDLAWEY